MAMYGSLIFMTGILGGWVADRLLGSRKSLLLGSILIMFGHVVLSLPFGLGAFLISMILIIVGSGLMKPNISNVVGGLYHKNDNRLDAGFVIFYMSVNMGLYYHLLLLTSTFECWFPPRFLYCSIWYVLSFNSIRTIPKKKSW